MAKYKHDGRFEAWLKVIAIREAWKVRSHRSKESQWPDHVEHLNIKIESTVLDKLSCEEILTGLEVIPLGPREVFKMYVLEGYKHAEIAEIMNIAESTSRVHLTNARKAFRKMLTQNKESVL